MITSTVRTHDIQTSRYDQTLDRDTVDSEVT